MSTYPMEGHHMSNLDEEVQRLARRAAIVNTLLMAGGTASALAVIVEPLAEQCRRVVEMCRADELDGLTPFAPVVQALPDGSTQRMLEFLSEMGQGTAVPDDLSGLGNS